MAIDILEANVSFSGSVKIYKNNGSYGGISNFETGGGGIRAMVSSISFTGNTVFEGNCATTNGGAIAALLKTTLSFSGNVTFSNNSANGKGGAIFLTDSSIISNANITFISNRAQNGGAMYFEDGANIILKQNGALSTSYNYAYEYGGGIYHSDAITPSQCELSYYQKLPPIFLPSCFIDVVIFLNNTSLLLASSNDSAGKDGSFLYGGLLDKCQVLVFNNTAAGNVALSVSLLYEILLNLNISSVESTHTSMTKPITSQPYVLCFCESIHEKNCSEVKSLETYRGRKFTVSLITLAQGNSISSTPLHESYKFSATARLNITVPSRELH